MSTWRDGYPRGATHTRYLNETVGGGGGGGGGTSSIVSTESFHSIANGTLAVTGNTAGATVSAASMYCRRILTTINGVTTLNVFVNWDFDIVGTAGDIQFDTVGAGIPDPLPADGNLVANFCHGLKGSGGETFNGIVTLDGAGSLRGLFYSVFSGNNHRGQVSVTQVL